MATPDAPVVLARREKRVRGLLLLLLVPLQLWDRMGREVRSWTLRNAGSPLWTMCGQRPMSVDQRAVDRLACCVIMAEAA